MNMVLPLFLRRMRLPLIVLIAAYAIAVAGFTVLPGVDDAGEPWRMSIFEAFYVVSYTGSTIGFGEIPYEFSNAQRSWMVASIYLTVFAWLFAVGTIISLLQDPAFREALRRARLQRSLGSFTEPFYIVCGYGDCGRMLVRSLHDMGRRMVVIDQDPANIEALSLRDMGVNVPAFCMDAGTPDNLLAAGLQHRWCVGVLAVTDAEETNLRIAIAARLLNTHVRVYARAREAETEANMRSFGTHGVVNPAVEFADRLELFMTAPDSHRVLDWLSSLPGRPLPERKPPPEGTWILCGYGELGRAVYHALRRAEVAVVVVDPEPVAHDCPPGTIRGKGTEAATLEEAGIGSAAVVVAGTPDDADNLSILMTAREMRPDLYQVAVENRLDNRALFEALNAELLVRFSYIVTTRFLASLSSPLIETFLDEARSQGNGWNRRLAERIHEVSQGMTPENWSARVSERRTPALWLAHEAGEPVPLETLCSDPRDRDRALDCVTLMLQRDGEDILLPGPETELLPGDRLLFCGRHRALELMARTVEDPAVVHYLRTGEERPDGWLWRALSRASGG